MKERTITALNALNHRFYAEQHEPFDRSRRQPWPGWSKLRERPDFPRRPRVLDVGCGNGRFLEFLQSAQVRPLSYLGIDFCSSLLRRAWTRQTGAEDLARDAREGVPSPRALAHGSPQAATRAGLDPTRVRWQLHDFIREPLPDDGAPFDLVTLFGVMHHVPGEATRRRLLEQCAERLAAGGLLAVSFWRFLRLERLRRHQVSFESAHHIDLDRTDLEAGDRLLTFGVGPDHETRGALRYCHDCDEDEQARLTATLPLAVVGGYESDGSLGRLNQYVLMRRDH